LLALYLLIYASSFSHFCGYAKQKACVISLLDLLQGMNYIHKCSLEEDRDEATTVNNSHSRHSTAIYCQASARQTFKGNNK